MNYDFKFHDILGHHENSRDDTEIYREITIHSVCSPSSPKSLRLLGEGQRYEIYSDIQFSLQDHDLATKIHFFQQLSYLQFANIPHFFRGSKLSFKDDYFIISLYFFSQLIAILYSRIRTTTFSSFIYSSISCRAVCQYISPYFCLTSFAFFGFRRSAAKKRTWTH